MGLWWQPSVVVWLLERRSVWRTETVEPSMCAGKARGRGVAKVTSRTSNAADTRKRSMLVRIAPACMGGRRSMGVKLIGALVLLLAIGCSGNSADSGESPDALTDVSDFADSSAETEVKFPAVPFDWCDPDTPPDDVCHAQKRDPNSEKIALALEIAYKQIEDHPPESLPWNWEEAVLMVGLLELDRVVDDPALRGYYRAWMDHHIDEGYVLGSSDTCVPAVVAVHLYHQTGDEKYGAVVEEALHYLYEVAKRTEQGGISHLGTMPIVTLWVDSLFMFGSVLTDQGELFDDGDALDELSKQLGIFSDLLQSPSGFFQHAYGWPSPQEDDVFWGRGNGWVAVSSYRYLRVRTNRFETDPDVAEMASKLIGAALQFQDPGTGLWWTVLNHPGESYLETSAAALFACGMARGFRYGFLGDEVLPAIHAAMAGVDSRIMRDTQDRPVVTGISGPTGVNTLYGYAAIPLKEDLSFGLGAVIMALVETSGIP